MNKQIKEINTEEILDLIHTSGLFSSNPIDDCPKCKCPIYFSCPNCIKHKLEEVYEKGKQDILTSTFIDNEIDERCTLAFEQGKSSQRKADFEMFMKMIDELMRKFDRAEYKKISLGGRIGFCNELKALLEKEMTE